ncbi:hypothetical protein BDW74DRAFT_181273 [Aspergillus multicolor]|uniref:uncharacterized protein n=1 Tax=Aspergillus multicolor TaxID=41759 RepID=UPI003CCD0397
MAGDTNYDYTYRKGQGLSNDRLTLSHPATLTKSKDAPTVDIPTHTFSAGHCTNLLELLRHLNFEIETHQPYCSLRSWSSNANNVKNTPVDIPQCEQHSTLFSGSHSHRPGILACLLINSLLIVILVLLCYVWFSFALLLIPPRARDINITNESRTETMDQYTRHIHFSHVLMDWYLLPLFASILACSHRVVRMGQAIRRRTLAVYHLTIDVQKLQDALTEGTGINAQMSKEVFYVTSGTNNGTSQVLVIYTGVCAYRLRTRLFDHVILATSAGVADQLMKQNHWKNGDDGVWLVGDYASAGIPLLETCVCSGLEAAEGIGATLPFNIIRVNEY